jgi:mRNA-degrading endonuclease toxin of MazEF toxin-antitoxin module
LAQDTVVNVTRVFTIDRRDLHRRRGILPPSVMVHTDDGLRLARSL